MKIFLGLLLAIACIMTTGCTSCQTENKNQEQGIADSVEVGELVVENTISADR